MEKEWFYFIFDNHSPFSWLLLGCKVLSFSSAGEACPEKQGSPIFSGTDLHSDLSLQQQPLLSTAQSPVRLVGISTASVTFGSSALKQWHRVRGRQYWQSRAEKVQKLQTYHLLSFFFLLNTEYVLANICCMMLNSSFLSLCEKKSKGSRWKLKLQLQPRRAQRGRTLVPAQNPTEVKQPKALPTQLPLLS